MSASRARIGAGLRGNVYLSRRFRITLTQQRDVGPPRAWEAAVGGTLFGIQVEPELAYGLGAVTTARIVVGLVLK